LAEVTLAVALVVGFRFFRALLTIRTDEAALPLALGAVRGRGGVSLAFFLTLKTLRFLAVLWGVRGDCLPRDDLTGVANGMLILLDIADALVSLVGRTKVENGAAW